MTRGCEALQALRRAVEESGKYFDKRGVLNSDGRRLVARAARIEARRGRRRVAQLLWSYLKNPTLEEAKQLAVKLEDYYCGEQD